MSESKSSATFTVGASWMWEEVGRERKALVFGFSMHIKTAMHLGWQRGIGRAKSCWPLQLRARRGNDTCLLNYLLMYLGKDLWNKCQKRHYTNTHRGKAWYQFTPRYLPTSKPQPLDSVTVSDSHKHGLSLAVNAQGKKVGLLEFLMKWPIIECALQ